MEPNEIDQDLLVKAICWKLGVEPGLEELEQLEEKWIEFTRNPDYQSRVRSISTSLSSLIEKTLITRLEQASSSSENEEIIYSLVDRILAATCSSISFDQVKEWDKVIKNHLKPIIIDSVRQCISKKKSPGLPEFSNKVQSHQQSQNQQSGVHPDHKQQHEHGEGEIQDITQDKQTKIQPPKIQQANNLGKSVAQAQWNYKPIPCNDEPDSHDEYYTKSITTPEGFNLIGARVRGKMHKHNGTNCDDWFDFAVSGKWTIIAVSDGAGSYKFSRLGARVSCEAAIKYLSERLKEHQMRDRQNRQELIDHLVRDGMWRFCSEDIEYVQTQLHESITSAYQALNSEVDKKSKLAAYYKALDNKDLNIKDLSATLLLAVHTTIKVGSESYSFIMSCQVGDGAIAAISQEGTLKLLSFPDNGKYGGQTDFLTSPGKLERGNLVQKISAFPGKLKTFMMMTDGVSEDYFPYQTEIPDLYVDLIINRVLTLKNATSLDSEQNSDQRWSSSDLSQAFPKVERLLDPGNDSDKEPQEVRIFSLSDYLNSEVLKEKLRSPKYLQQLLKETQEVSMFDGSEHSSPQEKLRIWLDSYYKKGSFDDRTLVVLYSEGK